MQNICSICKCHDICDTQVSSLKLARYGSCESKNRELQAQYSAMSNEELIKVLEDEKSYKNMCWYIEANKVYQSRFSCNYIQ